MPVQQELEKAIGHPITPYRIREEASPGHGGESGQEVRVSRPERMQLSAATGRAEGPVVPEQTTGQEPPEMVGRHEAEMRKLQEEQATGGRALEEEHACEMQNVPRGPMGGRA